MGYSFPRQQPAVVLRSQFNWLLALLATTLICVGALTVAVGILAGDSAEPAASTHGPLPAQLQKTGSESGTSGPLPARLPETSDEPGTSGPLPARLPTTSHEPGTSGPLPAQLPKTGYDGGPVSRYEGEAKYFIVR